jgi:hypothetical protein
LPKETDISKIAEKIFAKDRRFNKQLSEEDIWV